MRSTFPLLALLAACGQDNGFTQIKDYGGVYESSISGRVCDTTTNQWLEGATVYTNIIVNGELVGTSTTTTDADGNWQLTELRNDTTYTIYYQYGSAILDMFDVPIGEVEDVVLEEPVCSSASSNTVAIVSGNYDEISAVLSRFGVTDFYEVNGTTGDDIVEFLRNGKNLSQYQAILFAGGHTEEDVFYDSDGSDADGDVPRVLQSLHDYVQAGGTVWATDWSYDVVEQAWGEKIDFYGDDAVPNAAQLGTPGAIRALITNTDLENAVGDSHVQVDYELDTWPLATGAGGGVDVLEEGDAAWRFGLETGTENGVPLAMRFGDGKGQVIYTTWTLAANAGDGEAVIRHLLESL